MKYSSTAPIHIIYVSNTAPHKASGEQREREERIKRKKEKKRVCARGHRPFYCFAAQIKPTPPGVKEEEKRKKEKKRVCARGHRPSYCFAAHINPAEGE
ncbi:MAG: hypothetical protein LBI58_03990 [Tannerellaceae bacterium]|jgi:hypothetical protein|nr:hypothetical protein [Tannerellaceae bacterium]